MPVVTLYGPRQSGKTTLARAAFPKHAYVTLEDPSVRADALGDPRGFLRRISKGAILDEVHRAPDLLSYIQGLVDDGGKPGRFILTSSQNLLLMRSVSQSLAGRTAILRLLPLSVAEVRGWRSRPLERTLAPRKQRAGAEAAPWPEVWRGFYPRVCADGVNPAKWLAAYVATYVERDVREVLRIGDTLAFERFLVAVASRTSQELNLSDLASDVGITHPTAAAWISALEVSSIVMLVPPFHANYGKMLRKRPKLHFLDTGVACSLLRIRDAETLDRHPLRGAIFESFVAGEIMKAICNRGERARIYHSRDSQGGEVDLILDLGDRRIGIEVKSGETVAGDWTDGLRRWLDLPGNSAATGVVVHGGNVSYDTRGVAIRPWWGV